MFDMLVFVSYLGVENTFWRRKLLIPHPHPSSFVYKIWGVRNFSLFLFLDKIVLFSVGFEPSEMWAGFIGLDHFRCYWKAVIFFKILPLLAAGNSHSWKLRSRVGWLSISLVDSKHSLFLPHNCSSFSLYYILCTKFCNRLFLMSY